MKKDEHKNELRKKKAEMKKRWLDEWDNPEEFGLSIAVVFEEVGRFLEDVCMTEQEDRPITQEILQSASKAKESLKQLWLPEFHGPEPVLITLVTLCAKIAVIEDKLNERRF